MQSIQPEKPSTQVANDFNYYFANIEMNLANQFLSSKPTLVLPRIVENDFHLEEITHNEVISTINKMSLNKAAGHDGIPTRVLKDNIDILCTPICHVFNLAFASSSYPDILKRAKVVPVYKSGYSNQPENYRPISVLSVINTVFEKLISNRLKRFLNENNVICPQQHGFVPSRSTSTAVLTLTQLINSVLHQNKLIIEIFLDIKKAFDTVSHSILLQKLESYGVTNNSLEFFSSYLSSRKQMVVMSDYYSTYSTVTSGVPQGSVLGPILFSLYNDDLPNSLQNSNVLLYADDTALLFTGDTLPALQTHVMAELPRISSWFLENKLTLNSNKTKYVVFRSRRNNVDTSQINIRLNNSPIQEVDSFKYLGLIIDQHVHYYIGSPYS